MIPWKRKDSIVTMQKKHFTQLWSNKLINEVKKNGWIEGNHSPSGNI
jgi:hypothetical protein